MNGKRRKREKGVKENDIHTDRNKREHYTRQTHSHSKESREGGREKCSTYLIGSLVREKTK